MSGRHMIHKVGALRPQHDGEAMSSLHMIQWVLSDLNTMEKP